MPCEFYGSSKSGFAVVKQPILTSSTLKATVRSAPRPGGSFATAKSASFTLAYGSHGAYIAQPQGLFGWLIGVSATELTAPHLAVGRSPLAASLVLHGH